MQHVDRRCALKAAGMLGVTALSVKSAAATNITDELRQAGTFKGRVDDLDFIAKVGWCQVILRNGNEELVATTSEPRMQTLLELAFITGKSAEISYNEGSPKVLARVKVNREAVGGK
jgi:hypothetical protein